MRAIIAFIAISGLVYGCASFGGFSGGAHYQKKHGVYVENAKVSTLCLVPRLRHVIAAAERHFNAPVVVSSGYRNPIKNWRNGGARHSLHKKCQAADVFVPGVPKPTLIAYMMQDGLVGGVGCYPGRKFIHIDVRERPRGNTRPVTFSGC
ncbi:MAG TPA: D-Ala-D-Ala carboxypeptidase family metallohydrolase [Devosiaceae bacterium]|nr:D-Ala-D-Ala carboxypeptidase family metallohydrolase [Devosiaceae bacterium]